MSVPSIDRAAKLFSAFVQGYIHCLLCFGVVEQDENGEMIPAGHVFDLSSASDELLLTVYQDCATFMFTNLAALIESAEPTAAVFAQHGHDFYLTRNRHGAGFWDRGYDKHGAFLTEMSHLEGEQLAYYDAESNQVEILS